MDVIAKQTYLVGGAVRDQLLGQEPAERDWVVVGSSPEQLAQLGMRPVGREFPVFIHPRTGEEYALARTERKSGHGYGGFTFFTAPEISLEQDLERRDLTINAMAISPTGELIDPFNGLADLQQRQLRHVSPAFAEDPLRILRVARFVARFHRLGFRIANETLGLMRLMAVSGELRYLTPERVWQETLKALKTDAPHVYFATLRQIGALKDVFPELDVLFGVPQPPRFHPEIDTGIHSLLALDVISELSRDPVCRFATLVHDLGKGTTPQSAWPKHRGHEERGVKPIQGLTKRLGAGKDYTRLATLVSRWHLHSHRATQLRPATLLKLFDALDIWRRPQTLEDFLLCCEADARGRTGLQNITYAAADYLRGAGRVAREVRPGKLNPGASGKALGEDLRRGRLARLEQYKSERSG